MRHRMCVLLACAWVLWYQDNYTISLRWELREAYETKGACDRELRDRLTQREGMGATLFKNTATFKENRWEY